MNNTDWKPGKIIVGYLTDGGTIYASDDVEGHAELKDLYSQVDLRAGNVYKNSWRFNKEKRILFFWDLPSQDKINKVKEYLENQNYIVSGVESLRDYDAENHALALYLSHGDAYDKMFPAPSKPAKIKSYTYDPNIDAIAEYKNYYSYLINEDLRSESDEYYYHVTLAPYLHEILLNGLEPDRASTVSNYSTYSRGKVFLCDIGVVDWWKHNIEQHAISNFDEERYHQVVVVKIKKDKLNKIETPQIDTVGSQDSKGNCYYVTDTIPYDIIEVHESHIDRMDSIKQIDSSILDQLAVAAQKVYDDWAQDADGHDEMVGYGGICHIIADELIDILQRNSIQDCQTVCSTHEQHVYVVGRFKEGVYQIDIPYRVYESGAAFTWKKIPDVKFDRNHIVIYRLDRDPDKFNQYIDEI